MCVTTARERKDRKWDYTAGEYCISKNHQMRLTCDILVESFFCIVKKVKQIMERGIVIQPVVPQDRETHTLCDPAPNKIKH